MSILVKGTDFGPTEQVTSTKLDNLVDAAKFTNTSETAVSYTGSTGTCLQGGGLEVTTAGQLQIQDGEVDLVKLSTNNALNSGLYGVLDKVYPVGSIYIATVSTNPDTLMFGVSGHTTWTAFGAGKTLVGIDSGDTDFDTSEETGGNKTTTTTTVVPIDGYGTTGGSPGTVASGRMVVGSGNPEASETLESLRAAGNTQTITSSDINVVQPYIVVYMWKRTA